jgi:cyanophycinase
MTQKRMHSTLKGTVSKSRIPKKLRQSKFGQLIIIGGREGKQGEMKILKEIAERNDGGKLVVMTAASEVADELWEEYRRVFRELGIKKVEHLPIAQPEEARDPKWAGVLQDAKTVFFTGGDQLRITSKIGGTGIEDFINEIYQSGGIIAGTSAGASVMGQTMLVGGENAESHKVGNWMMAPGLGFARGMIIDQHFAQRGRIGRLLGAVALNPGILGIGIDEDTAIIVEEGSFRVIGTNAVYVVDGHSVSYTNISEASAEKTMSMHDVKLHILADGEVYDFKSRKALCASALHS